MSDPYLWDDLKAEVRELVAVYEKKRIAETLKRFDNSVTHTAQILGLSRRMLQLKMKAYDLR